MMAKIFPALLIFGFSAGALAYDPKVYRDDLQQCEQIDETSNRCHLPQTTGEAELTRWAACKYLSHLERICPEDETK
jgi:hypothetical protein